jgi:2',3'-cyclic-nucleotide 2'-phosphodiesterase (5'-nucleotidase family)
MAEYTTLEQVKIRLGQFHIDTVTNDDETTSDVVVFDNKEDNPVIEQLIKQATEDVKAKRNYPNSYTDEMITKDLRKFESVIVNLVVYDHSQAGEEFMASFSENGVSRNWKSRDDLFVGIFPFAKVL